eukprot:1290915-Amphidinium_carterae.2
MIQASMFATYTIHGTKIRARKTLSLAKPYDSISNVVLEQDNHATGFELSQVMLQYNGSIVDGHCTTVG